MKDKIKKIIKENLKFMVLLSLAFFPIILNFFFWITDTIAGKKGIENLSIIYSSVGNEEWLSYWGNVVSGILPLAIILYYREENKRQQEQFNKQLELQYKQLKIQEEQQHQNSLVEKLNKEEKIAKKILKAWNNSTFDNLFISIENYYNQLLYENYQRVRNRKLMEKQDDITYKNIQFEFQEDYNRKKNNLIYAFNYGMLEINLLPWRLNISKENLEGYCSPYYTLKKECYESFKILHNKFLEDFLLFFSEQYNLSPTLNNCEIEKNFNEFNDKKKKLLLEYSNLYTDAINKTASYFYFCNQCIKNKKFEVFDDKTFFKKDDKK